MYNAQSLTYTIAFFGVYYKKNSYSAQSNIAKVPLSFTNNNEYATYNVQW